MPELDVEQLVEAVTRQVLARLGRTDVSAPGRTYDPARPLVAANWKMNPCTEDVGAYVAELVSASDEADVVLFPPAVLIGAVAAEVARAGRRDIALGGQDVHWEAAGAHTGELSGALLTAVGARWTLVGHSERRQAGETDEQVHRKLRAGRDAGLAVMVCVGESAEERRTGATFRVLRSQIQAALGRTALRPPEPASIAVAYEPVWAIGSGQKATGEQIQEAAAFVRRVVGEIYDHNRARQIRVLYGGSVGPANAGEVMSAPDVNGLLVGGASLGGRSFADIIDAAAAGSKGSEVTP